MYVCVYMCVCILSLEIIFRNIIATSIYPDTWKLANVALIFKNGDKQLTKNIDQYLCFPSASHLNVNNLITKNQSGFRPGDSTTNHLSFLVSEIHQALENLKSLEVRAAFLDISETFDKVWHDGLIFKLE